MVSLLPEEERLSKIDRRLRRLADKLPCDRKGWKAGIVGMMRTRNPSSILWPAPAAIWSDVQQLYRRKILSNVWGTAFSGSTRCSPISFPCWRGGARLRQTGLIYSSYKTGRELMTCPCIQSLLRFYKRAYMIIGAVIAAAGLVLSFYDIF